MKSTRNLRSPQLHTPQDPGIHSHRRHTLLIISLSRCFYFPNERFRNTVNGEKFTLKNIFTLWHHLRGLIHYSKILHFSLKFFCSKISLRRIVWTIAIDRKRVIKVLRKRFQAKVTSRRVLEAEFEWKEFFVRGNNCEKRNKFPELAAFTWLCLIPHSPFKLSYGSNEKTTR